jgi:hypothetical protein
MGAYHKGHGAAKPRPKKSGYLPQRRKGRKEIPLFPPFGKGGKRGISPKWRPADAVHDMLGARMILSI